MSTREDDRSGDSFLGRWSRLKQQTRSEEAAAPSTAPPAPQAPKPDLPPVESLNFDSNFKEFLHPEVGEDLRRLALRKLFSDPRFNVMDGLDVYIDDYGIPDPIPEAMLRNLSHAARALGIGPEEASETAALAQQVSASAQDAEPEAEPGSAEGQAAAAEPPEPAEPMPTEALPGPDEGPANLDKLSGQDPRREKVHISGGAT